MAQKQRIRKFLLPILLKNYFNIPMISSVNEARKVVRYVIMCWSLNSESKTGGLGYGRQAVGHVTSKAGKHEREKRKTYAEFIGRTKQATVWKLAIVPTKIPAIFQTAEPMFFEYADTNRMLHVTAVIVYLSSTLRKQRG